MEKASEIMALLPPTESSKIFDSLANTIWKGEPSMEVDKLRKIFSYNILNPERFPNVSGIDTSFSARSKIHLYLEKWGSRFFNAGLPSETVGKKSSSPYDQVVYMIITLMSDNEVESEDVRRYHEMAMAAENIIGSLLEEYINTCIEQFGWIWCKGNVMTATDFFLPGRKTVLLQIKNKYNTENSSSDKIREGTTIQKWFRLTKGFPHCCTM